jgi:hypothetical protein
MPRDGTLIRARQLPVAGSDWIVRPGVVVLGIAATLAGEFVLNDRDTTLDIAAEVAGYAIRWDQIDREAGEQLCTAIRRVQHLRLESREYLIARHLIQEEAFQTGRTNREIFRTEIAGRLVMVSEQDVVELATIRSRGRSPSPDLLQTAREDLETDQLLNRRDSYLAALAAKHIVSRRPVTLADADVWNVCDPDDSAAGSKDVRRPSAGAKRSRRQYVPNGERA